MESDATHNKEHSGATHNKVHNHVERVRKNPWMVSSVVLALVAVVLVILIVRGGVAVGSVSESTASSNLISFINSQGNGEATVVSSVDDGDMYKITVSYNGQQIPVYVTKDGKYLVSDKIPLTSSGADTSQTQTSNTPVNLNVGDSPVIGNENAKVTVIEFSDFSCPFCAAASGDNEEMNAYMKQRSPSWEPIVTNLMKDYVDTGKVRFSVKYTMGHSGGHPAQLVSWCLNEQNLYWKFYPKAYAQQADVEDLTKMKALAQSVGADMTKLQTCLDSKKYDSRFDVEQAEGSAAGVQGTPAFFINGQLVSGAVPYSQVKSIIEAELAK